MVWERCLDCLEADLTSQQFNTLIRPLHAVEDGPTLRLLAPNTFVRDEVDEHHLEHIRKVVHYFDSATTDIIIQVGSRVPTIPSVNGEPSDPEAGSSATGTWIGQRSPIGLGLREEFTFEQFVVGKSNQMAQAASEQVVSNPGDTYNNPLFIYGDTGLGKTHLMHAIGHRMLEVNTGLDVIYTTAEQFMQEMITALRNNTINDFKALYRSVDLLLIDDIQFFVGKERTQEEFFHTFTTLLERKKPVVLTCDKFPKAIRGLNGRLKSRFGGGLSVVIDPPELETRVAILMKKATAMDIDVPDTVAYFIARRMKSNVRELEGALHRVIAHAKFTGRAVTDDLTQEALRDLIVLEERLFTIENIQQTVAQYFKIGGSDLTSKKRTRSIARPRQIAMTLARELTNHSLPEIGDAFGGRDHTTVLYACKRIKKLCEQSVTVADDYKMLLRILTSS